MHSELPPLIVWIALWMVNTYSKFQLISSVNTDTKKNVKVFVSQKMGIILKKKKMNFEIVSLGRYIALSIVNTYSKFRVNILSNSRDITKCQSFSKSKTGHNSEKKNMHFELSPLLVWIALWIVNMYCQFQ